LNSDRTTSEFTAVHRPDGTTVSIPDGRVRCTSFPIIVMTSNGEREFPPAFLRRCIRLDIQPIRDLDRLAQIVRTHLGDDLFQKAELLIRKYIADYAAQQKSSAKQEYIAIDQLLNFLFVVLQIDEADEKGREQLRTSLLRDLGN
jgi:MoxR-like ATPase